MAKLHGDRDFRMFADRSQHRLQGRLGRIVIKAEIARGDAADGFHGGRLDNQHAGTGQRQAAQMDHMPVGGAALFRRILAHGRNDDAVGQSEVAQLGRREQFAHGKSEAGGA